MDKFYRTAFNTHGPDALFAAYRDRLHQQVGNIPFRLAETPLFLDKPLREELARSSSEIVQQLSQPDLMERFKKAIPADKNVPGMDALPNCVQVDYALCQGPDGRLTGRVVELQAFPSLYALMDLKCQVWTEVFQGVPELAGAWHCYLSGTREQALTQLRQAVLGDEDPEHVVLVDIEPDKQKTLPDFAANRMLTGVDWLCITKLKREGNRLFREKDGKRIPVKRIYNRLVFDELDRRPVELSFAWTDPLEVTWCSHPNWYWTWSKFVLPHLRHPAVPVTQYLSDLQAIPADLENYVLKPLFSFAGSGVVVDVTPQAIDAIPAQQRPHWVLQQKVTYVPAVTMPDGTGVKAEVRVMLLRPPHATELKPTQLLVRLSRGKMIGVDHNKDMPWTGGGVGMWHL